MAKIAATVLLLLSGLHIYWAFGGKWGVTVTVPEKDGDQLFRSGTIETLLVAVGLAALAVLALVAEHSPQTRYLSFILRVLCGLVGTVFFVRSLAGDPYSGYFKYSGFFKRVRGTRYAHWDTRLYSPLCFLLGTVFLVLALR